MDSRPPSSIPKIPRAKIDGADTVRRFRQRPKNEGAAKVRQLRERPPGSPSKSMARRAVVAVVAVVLVGAAAAIVWLNTRGSSPGPAAPTVAQQIDSLASATTVASKTAFTGSCHPTGLAVTFPVRGDVTVYANASLRLDAQPVKPEEVFAASGYQPPAAISLDAAWWDVSGRKAGKMALAGTATDARTQAPVSLICDVDLPAPA